MITLKSVYVCVCEHPSVSVYAVQQAILETFLRNTSPLMRQTSFVDPKLW